MMHRSAEVEEHDELNEMNLTPFIDVMLVLLIIFMIAAQDSAVSQPVTLPGSTAERLVVPGKPCVVAVKADGTLLVNDQAVGQARLGQVLAAAGASPQDRILLLGDKAVSYERLMNALDGLRAAGYLHVGLVGMDQGEAK
jgi:biopolymer transport protein ExbD